MSISQSDQRPPPPVYRLLAAGSLLVPLIAALVFVQLFAGPLPLTDEWTYTHALREMHDIDWDSDQAWDQFKASYPVRHSEHLVGVPFALYAPIVEIFNYDSRWVIRLTVLGFAVIGLIVWRRLLPHPLTALPVMLLLFCPSHFMEFLWGWQVTLTLSILFPLAGLAVLDRILTDTGFGRMAFLTLLGTILITLGSFSSAGGFFGFPAAMLLIALKPLSVARRAGLIAVLIVVALIIYDSFLSKASPVNLAFGWRDFWYVMTAQGATLWGSPVGLTEFQWDVRSTGGLLILAGTVAVTIRALILKQLSNLALPLSFIAFGYLCVIPIALARPYLGNWHLQYALPAVFGAYALAMILWRSDPSRWTRVPSVVLMGLLLSCLVGYQQGFAKHGPAYHDYITAIEDYTLNHLPYPDRHAPYPPQAAHRDMDAKLTLFLAAHGNPVFPAPARLENPYPPGTPIRAYLDDQEVSFPVSLANVKPPSKLLAIILQIDHPPHALVAQIGSELRWMPRVHESFIPATAHAPRAAYYLALIQPSHQSSDVSIGRLAPFAPPRPEISASPDGVN